MIYLTSIIPNKVGYVIPIGDLHFGDRAFKQKSFQKVKGYIKWVERNKNSRVVLGGDLFNVATRQSKTSPFEQVEGEFEKVIALFYPIRSQIVGAIEGNHEWRLVDFANFSLMNAFCQRLGIKYMGISGVVNFKVGKRNTTESYKGGFRQNYHIYFHHTTGGGTLAGGGLNRTERLRSLVEGCDAYCSFHNHRLFAEPQEIYFPSAKAKAMGVRRYWFIGCGSYLEWKDSYAERSMFSPQKLGSPRIRLNGTKKHDLHVSL